MLGLTSYQEALRALGSLFGPADRLRIAESAGEARIQVTSVEGSRLFDASQLEEIVLNSHARRGGSSAAGSLSDVLRSVGRALDELHASDICLQVDRDSLTVRFADDAERSHDLTYAGDELEALRRAAAARRNGQPLSRVLILQSSAESAAPVVELLVAEFAVQALPTLYARAVASSAEPPDLVLAQTGLDLGPTIAAIERLRAGPLTAAVPILVMADAAAPIEDARAAFSAGADDLLREPVLPAQLRARVRTWLLRKRVDG
jgi:CheY-like chemotaxis protein